MYHPPSSHLSSAALDAVRQLAGQLREAAAEVTRLTTGGRMTDIEMAGSRWSGPHGDTFVRLVGNELDTARRLQQRLADEADEWVSFLAAATDAGNERLRDQRRGH